MKQLFSLLLVLVLGVPAVWAQKGKSYTVASPDKNIQAKIDLKDKLYYSVKFKGKEVLLPSGISLTLGDGKIIGQNPKLKGQKTSTVNATITPLYGKKSSIPDNYNELRLDFTDNYSLVCRAYNEGFAYRLETRLNGKIKVMKEEAGLAFKEDYPAYVSLTNTFDNAYENFFNRLKISEFPKGQMAMLPLVVQADNVNIGFTEADLYDYSALYFVNDGPKPKTLTGINPKYPTKEKIGGHMNFVKLVTETADYIAETNGTREFPWRIFILAEKDTDLLNNDLVYKLSKPADPKMDFSWVKPGKVAWDWWNATNLTGVDFKSGVNTQTYKYFIDFAAANKLEYVNLDEGWSDQYDLMKMKPDVNMTEIMSYAKQKNVGIILWCVWETLDRQLIPAMDMFQKWGIAGIKVDFMQRDDQKMVNYYERVAREAAKRKILVNFHGAYKPTGMHRAFPNVINHEGVRGLEWNKFNQEGTTPEHAATLPFTRMLAGYFDYTPGAMRNAIKSNYKTINDEPMSQGTRCHQLAMYVVYDMPLAMLSDAPTAYQKEPVILDFLAKVPTTWDETKALDGKIADYAVIARRKGTNWYVGGLSDWTARTQKLDFSFLGNGEYTAEIFADGVNADRVGTDYKKMSQKVNKNTKLELPMAPGGGFAIRLTPAK